MDESHRLPLKHTYLVGDTILDLLFLQKNGNGTFLGQVSMPKESQCNVKVIIKIGVLHTYDDWNVKMLFQEHMSLSLLHQEEGIPRICDWFSSPLHTVLINEYTPGITLRELQYKVYQVEPHRFSRSLLFEIISSLLQTLTVVHEYGITHFDIKPENIIITGNEDGSLKKVTLIDFGISRLEEMDLFDPRDCPGTQSYMSKQGSRGRCFCDQTEDLYAVGVIVHEFLKEHKENERNPFPKQFLDKCCSQDVATRYQNANQMQQALKLTE